MNLDEAKQALIRAYDNHGYLLFDDIKYRDALVNGGFLVRTHESGELTELGEVTAKKLKRSQKASELGD